MTKPIAICLERTQEPGGAPFFTTCVALPVGESGLGLTAEGAIAWKQIDDDLVMLRVAPEGDLVLTRPAGAPEVQLHRSGRTRDLGADETLEVLQGDLIIVAGEREFRLHVHGPAPAVVPPSLVDVEPRRPVSRAGATLSKVAAAAVIGAAGVLGGGAGCETMGCGAEQEREIPVRPEPPIVAMPPDEPPPLPPEPPAQDGSVAGDGAAVNEGADTPEPPPQEPTPHPVPPAGSEK